MIAGFEESDGGRVLLEGSSLGQVPPHKGRSTLTFSGAHATALGVLVD